MSPLPGDLRYNQFFKRLRKFGVIEVKNRGKGSEKYLVRPNEPGTTKGPSYTVRCHGKGDTVKIGAIRACLRRLRIDPKDFW
ncbi:MAG: type II toxin-antitoxin system HicA family toxin [Thermodesulfobacteriota bacterium]|nr:type II toxin-antitoxin system HicA family toxin [Thermodesulfobacteriota bacterium]